MRSACGDAGRDVGPPGDDGVRGAYLDWAGYAAAQVTRAAGGQAAAASVVAYCLGHETTVVSRST